MTPPDESTALHSGVTSLYDGLFENDLHEELTGGSGFSNYGYWVPETHSVVKASEQLVDKLLEGVPKRGAILDVACGSGGTTARLANLYDRVTALNISHYQIARTRAKVPTCRALQMDGTRLAFTDASFDVVICVEAVFHFSNKARFFAEAHRVLKPGGWLVLSDIIMVAPRESYAMRLIPQVPPPMIFPHGNKWNLFAYRDILEVLGFTPSFTSAYQEACQAFFAFSNAICEAKIVAEPAQAGMYRERLAVSAAFNATISDYLLVAAQKA